MQLVSDRHPWLLANNYGVPSGAKYPLKAASYITCSVDLENQNWADGLIAKGFDPEVPTCWLLEGLVMYLSPVAVEKLLKGMHAVSATGSRLLIMVCSITYSCFHPSFKCPAAPSNCLPGRHAASRRSLPH